MDEFWNGFDGELRVDWWIGDYSNKDQPLSIPNREVKLVSADGTRNSGRVGHRLKLKQKQKPKQKQTKTKEERR